MKISLFIVLFSLLLFSGYSQQLYHKTVGNGLSHNLCDAEETYEGDFLISGYCHIWPVASRSTFLTRVNDNAVVQWNKSYHFDNNDLLLNFNQLHNSDIILTFTSTNYINSTYTDTINQLLFRANSSGIPIWVKRIPNLSGARVIADADSNIILAGKNDSLLPSSAIQIIKFNPNGDTIWTRIHSIATNENLSIEDLILTHDSAYILMGNIRSTNSWKTFITKISSDGSLIWSKILYRQGPNSSLSSTWIYETNSHELLLGHLLGGLVVNLNQNGNLIQNKLFYADSGNVNICDVKQTFDNGYILTGSSTVDIIYTFYYHDSASAVLIKLDSSFNMEWSRTYGQVSYYYGEWGNFVFQKADSGYWTTGGKSFVHNMMWDLYFISTNDTGYAVCQEIPRIILDSSMALVTSAYQWIITYGAEIYNDSVTTTNLVYNDSVICQNIITGIPDFKKSNVFIYPNPFKEGTLFKVNNDNSNEYLLEIFSSNGISVHQQFFSGNTLQFTRGKLNRGLYLYRISDASNLIGTGKLMIID
ncbi:T9SS type A sorting domain-containing protein [candidate division KSB1 bacterium]